MLLPYLNKVQYAYIDQDIGGIVPTVLSIPAGPVE